MIRRILGDVRYWGFWRWLAIVVDPGFGKNRRDRMPIGWQVEWDWPRSFRFRLRQAPAALRGDFLVMLNLSPWPIALGRAVATAASYLFRGYPIGSRLNWLPFERYVRRERAIMVAAEVAHDRR